MTTHLFTSPGRRPETTSSCVTIQVTIPAHSHQWLLFTTEP